MTDLQPCDILVKPQVGIPPSVPVVNPGLSFGHAAIVIRGATDTNEFELLKKVIVFESQARDVPETYQVRLIPAYNPGKDFSTANNNFGRDQLGSLYRLRMNLTPTQKDSIINWLLDQDEDCSSYRAMKRFSPDHDSFHRSPAEGGKKEFWYCSLLIWQAFYDVLGVDLDANHGLYVMPNDLIYSHHFDDEPGMHINRVRF